jgi:hypothetical protein
VAREHRAVVRVPKAGGIASELDGAAHRIAHIPIAADAQHANWIASDGALRRASDIGPVTSMPVLNGFPLFRRNVAAVAVGSGALFVVGTFYDDEGSWYARVERHPASGTTAAPAWVDIPSRAGVPMAVRVIGDALQVFWYPNTDIIDATTLALRATAPTRSSLVNLAVGPIGSALLVREVPDPLGTMSALGLFYATPAGTERALASGGHDRTGNDVAIDEDAAYWVRRETAEGPGIIERRRLR